MVFGLCSCLTSFAQFSRVIALPEQGMSGICISGSNIVVTGENNVVYRSMNDGVTWDSVMIDAERRINTVVNINNRLFLGTWTHGVYASDNGGESWIAQLGIQYPVTQIKKIHGQLYAASDGGGLFRFNQATGQWYLFHDEPQASNVSGMFELQHTIMFAGGGNGTWFKYDSSEFKWIPGFYFGTLAPGLQIDKCYQAGTALYAVSNRYVFKSTDDGKNWETDDQGARKGINRLMFGDNGNLFLVANTPQGGAWLQQKNPDESWSTGVFIPGVHVYDGALIAGEVWLATHKGVYRTGDLPSGLNPVDKENQRVSLYPQPVQSGAEWHVVTSAKVKSIKLISVAGKEVDAPMISLSTLSGFAPYASGIYYLCISFESGEVCYQKLVVN